MAGKEIFYAEGTMFGDMKFIKRTKRIGKKGYALFECPHCKSEFESRIDAIQSGRTKSCGCISKPTEYTEGQRLGYFTFIRRVPELHSGLFLCECGKEYLCDIHAVKTGVVKSCGCKTKELLSKASTKHIEEGSLIGSLIFVRRSRYENGRAYGIFTCPCSKEFEARIDSVHANRIKSCGCMTKQLVSAALKKEREPIVKHENGYKKMPLSIPQEDVDRFWSKVLITANDNKCWEWGGTKHRYGMFRLNGSMYKANRIAYFLHYKEDPNDLEVMHSCDNGVCCNPKHLSLGTHEENMRDMVEKGRNKNQYV